MPREPLVQRWERPGYQVPGGLGEPPGLAEKVRRRSAGSPVRAPAAVLDVAVQSASAPVGEAFEIETATFGPLLSAPAFPALSHLFSALRTVAGTATAAALAGAATPVAAREFPQLVRNPLAAVFFAPDAPVVEITDDAAEAAATDVRAHGGIPVVISASGGTSARRHWTRIAATA